MPPTDEQNTIIGDLLKGAIPLNPVSPNQYVTHGELRTVVEAIDAKIALSASQLRTWVLGGCVAILVAGGGGYVSLVSKLDRLTQALPVITDRQNTRWPWVQQQQQRDLMQDEVLKKLDREYQPLPYQAPPP